MMITSTNPMVYTDFPDPDIIRVGDVYYMATTTMHFTPGCDILRSYDLVHWEFIAHALNIVADTPEERLECEGSLERSAGSAVRPRRRAAAILPDPRPY